MKKHYTELIIANTELQENEKVTDNKISRDNQTVYTEDNIKKIMQINFLILWEMLIILKPLKMYVIQIIDFILENTSAASKTDSQKIDIIKSLKNGISKKHNDYLRRFTEYGISPEYFDGSQYITADVAVLKIAFNYLDSWDDKLFPEEDIECVEASLPILRETLCLNIFTIKNLDGTLVIDSVFNMIQDIINISDDVYSLTYKIVNMRINPKQKHLSQRILNAYYNEIAESWYATMTENAENKLLEITDEKYTVSNKSIYSGFEYADKVADTLFLIREVYLLLLEIDDNTSGIKLFYDYLGLTEDQYQKMLDDHIIENKELMKKLEPYKFPATLFRGDTPADIDCSTDIMAAYDYYKRGTITLSEFRNILKFHIFYKMDTKNIPIVIPTYSLYRDLNNPHESMIRKEINAAEAVATLDENEIQNIISQK